MGDPAPKKDNQPGDYIILDDTDSDPDSEMTTLRKLELTLWSLLLMKISRRPPL